MSTSTTTYQPGRGVLAVLVVLVGPDHPDGVALGAAQLQRLVEGRELLVEALLLVCPLVAGQVAPAAAGADLIKSLSPREKKPNCRQVFLS